MVWPLLAFAIATSTTPVASVATLSTLDHSLDGVVIAADGGAYVSTAEAGTIVRLAADGGRHEVHRAPNSYFVGLAVRGDVLYATEYNQGQVVRIHAGQSSLFASGIEGAGDLIVDRCGGGFIVAATRAGKVYRLDAKGARSELARDLPGVLGLAQDEAGTICAASLSGGVVYRLDPDGPRRLSTLAIAGEYKIGHLEYADGQLYATGIGDHRIYRISTAGQVEVLAGAAEIGDADGPAAAARFNAPNGIAADLQRGRLLISEYGGRRLRQLELAPASAPAVQSRTAFIQP